MVCLGNICRSPLAEGVMRHKLEEYSIQAEVDSAGTSAYHIGENPDPRSQENALSHGINISKLQARQFIQEDFDSFDLIFAMDKSNYNNIKKLARCSEDMEKVDFLLNESNQGMNLEVPDPYFGGEKGFETVYQLINEACEAVIQNHFEC